MVWHNRTEMTRKLKVCSRGHEFYKSSDCPVCPICWPGRAKKLQSDFPKLAAPALRALANAHIKQLSDLTKISEEELMELHGMGPNALETLKQSLTEKGLSFKT